MTPDPQFTLIDSPGMYGRTATVGAKRVQVVRAYQGQWLVFKYINRGDKPLHEPRKAGEPEYVAESTAMAQARAWLVSPV